MSLFPRNSDPRYELVRLSDSDSEFDDYPHRKRTARSSCAHYLRRFLRLLTPRRLPFTLLGALAFLLISTALFNPSYTSPAPFEIPEDERVFIAANIVNDDLIRGVWGKAIVDLVELIGPEKVFVSVYGGSTIALQDFEQELRCNSSIISESQEPIDRNTIPHIRLPSGEERIKRISYLAEVRNRALLPLESLDIQFDKILFLNDVVFDPKEAARLLFATNAVSEFEDGSGKVSTNYRAACAMDYISPFKYYDTFATRDLNGYGIGVPFFPYFADAENAESRKDVLAGKDAVRVKSCWGGMVAFDARFFQQELPKYQEAGTWRKGKEPTVKEKEPTHMGISVPVKFRSEESVLWDASECCLIHADIQASLPQSESHNTTDSGIFINPYVRVSYDPHTFSYLPWVKRIERLFSPIHNIANWIGNMPHESPRRRELAGDNIHEMKWAYDYNVNWLDDKEVWSGNAKEEPKRVKGSYKFVDRIAGKGGFCGGRQLLVMKEGVVGVGERNWEKLPIPPE